MRETPAAEPAAGFALRVVAQIPRLRRYATAWLHNVADADDLVQDTVERALQRQESLRDPARLGAWLLAILHNLHRSNLRRARRHGPLLAVDSLADDLAPLAPPEDRGEIRNLVRAMEQLSEDHRQILLLVGLEGLSYREIAELLEIPIGTVMSRLARARERLRITLEGGDDQTMRSIR